MRWRGRSGGRGEKEFSLRKHLAFTRYKNFGAKLVKVKRRTQDPGTKKRSLGHPAFVLSGLQRIQERLAGEIPRAKAELAKHCTEITLTPEGDSYKLSGEWDLPGDVRSDGAGGQNRTGYARLFRAALYQ